MNIKIEAKTFPIIKQLDFGNIKSTVTANSQYYMEDGKAKLFVAGEFHFERAGREFWEEEILKMKAGGINVISTYIVWLFHERTSGNFCFEGQFDVKHFLSLCKKHNMRVIMRIGPYAHGELRHGGFPDFIFNMPWNRSDCKIYLKYAERYWKKLFENTKEYCDGETIVGIQLENEYTKGFEHLKTLKQLATKIGFRTPIFTVTGWGFKFDENDLQGTYGGYAARPWAQHLHQMPVQGNFTIREEYHDYGIGDDVINYAKNDKPTRLVDQPNFTCECGCGNQVTEHRREIISTKDAFGVPFTTVANGCNWVGYYMYHGSNNPTGGLFQESRITLSPNNCPVIDYDFQAPLDRFGYPRESYKKLKGFNYFLNYYGDRLAPMWKFYSKELNITEETDATTPRLCVRADENGSGFLFVNTYEREKAMPDIKDMNVTVEFENEAISLPTLNVKSGEFVLYPFNIELCGRKFDYITATPVAHVTKDNITTYYFKTTGGLVTEYSSNGEVGVLKVTNNATELVYNEISKNAQIVVMSEKVADDFYVIDGAVVFTNAIVYGDSNQLTVVYKKGDYCIVDGKQTELETPKIKAGVNLRRRNPFKAKYSRYLFSHGKKSYYSLTAHDLEFSDNIDDYLVDFNFDGDTFQMYCGDTLVSDFFNYDGTHSMSLKYFNDWLKSGKSIDTVTAPFTSFHRVYTEKHFDKNTCQLKPVKITAYYKKEVKI